MIPRRGTRLDAGGQEDLAQIEESERSRADMVKKTMNTQKQQQRHPVPLGGNTSTTNGSHLRSFEPPNPMPPMSGNGSMQPY